MLVVDICCYQDNVIKIIIMESGDDDDDDDDNTNSNTNINNQYQ